MRQLCTYYEKGDVALTSAGLQEQCSKSLGSLRVRATLYFTSYRALFLSIRVGYESTLLCSRFWRIWMKWEPMRGVQPLWLTFTITLGQQLG
ncbi:hypothetical protein Scep_004436 [Stephania cephalantha]|uniref:Uncharacterized protein n=1 Tax=Stephania cephalantha TaxID=152367 RepID=A0AAP0KU90_9MAGN